jgi:RNA polymerase sigma factor (sigma-70 family)
VVDEVDELAAVSGGALERLYRDQWAPMVRLARLLTGSMIGAEDLVQDAFVRIASRPGGLEGIRSPAAFVRAAVVNACRSSHRHQAIVHRHEVRAPEPELPDHLVDFADVLARLPERQRAAIVLRHHCGLGDEEIAEVLGCRRSTVRSLVKRGLASLREVIE